MSGDLLAQAGDLFRARYPSGGCLPWHNELRRTLASA